MEVPALCPHCLQAMPQGTRSAVDVICSLDLPARQERVLLALARRVGQWVPLGNLIAELWGNDPDGGPLNANVIISIQFSRAKAVVRRAGFRVDARWGGRGSHGSVRRLVRIA